MLLSDYIKEYQHLQSIFANEKLDCSCQLSSEEMSEIDVLVKYQMYELYGAQGGGQVSE